MILLERVLGGVSTDSTRSGQAIGPISIAEVHREFLCRLTGRIASCASQAAQITTERALRDDASRERRCGSRAPGLSKG
jgi:hypothetical protein